jgi:outer membrane protein assembly factor BamB
MKRIKLLFTALLIFSGISNSDSQDWPLYLGPNSNSTSPQKGILRSWPEKGPEVLWTANVCPAYGGPLAQADGKLLIRDQSRLMCVKVAKRFL